MGFIWKIIHRQIIQEGIRNPTSHIAIGRCQLGQGTAIDDEMGASDFGGSIGSHEENGIGNVAASGFPAQRDVIPTALGYCV